MTATTTLRVRRETAETVRVLAEKHGRSQGDVLGVLVSLGAGSPALPVLLEQLPPLRAPAGEGRRFKKKTKAP